MKLLKYPGGKESELTVIKEYMPKNIATYYEPFVGGGSVYFASNAKNYSINDKSEELILLYKTVQQQDENFFKLVESIEDFWNYISVFVKDNFDYILSVYLRTRDNIISEKDMKNMITGMVYLNKNDLIAHTTGIVSSNFDKFLSYGMQQCTNKLKRIKKQELTKEYLSEKDRFANIEGAFKTAIYMYIRMLYNEYLTHKKEFNDYEIAALYLFIREMTYSAMFRFNKNGEFNVPYGGISYNNKSLKNRIRDYKNKEIVEKLQTTEICCEDFQDYINHEEVKPDDFLFIDPPYDTEFSEYNRLRFDNSDQKRLANYLIKECEGKFMIVIKKTDYIMSLYKANTLCKNGHTLEVYAFDKKYMVSFKNRNDKETEHLIIRNYE